MNVRDTVPEAIRQHVDKCIVCGTVVLYFQDRLEFIPEKLKLAIVTHAIQLNELDRSKVK